MESSPLFELRCNMEASILLALMAAYLGVGALLVHETEYRTSLGGWRGHFWVFVAAAGTAALWPYVAWQYLRQDR